MQAVGAVGAAPAMNIGPAAAAPGAGKAVEVGGALGQQMASLQANFQDTPAANLFAAILIALLLSKGDDDSKEKESSAGIFLAALAASALQGPQIEAFSFTAMNGPAGVSAAYTGGGGATSGFSLNTYA